MFLKRYNNFTFSQPTSKKNTVTSLPPGDRGPWTPDTAGVTIIPDTEGYPLCDLRKLAATLIDQSPRPFANMGCTGHLLTQAYLMTSWQALRALVSAIPFDDPFKTRAHTASGRTHLVCLIVESRKIA